MVRFLTLRIAIAALVAAGICGLSASSPLVLRGHLDLPAGKVPEEGKPLVFVAEGKSYILIGDEYSLGQLRDPNLAGRTWELEGSLTDDGRFDIGKLFTIKDGRRHVVKYYCVVCNIHTYSPGRCMCCQDDTELQETPETP